MAKRRIEKVKEYRITEAARDAWQAGDVRALHLALGLRPWEPSPLEIEGPCPWRAGTVGAQSWDRIAELRDVLAQGETPA